MLGEEEWGEGMEGGRERANVRIFMPGRRTLGVRVLPNSAFLLLSLNTVTIRVLPHISKYLLDSLQQLLLLRNSEENRNLHMS